MLVRLKLHLVVPQMLPFLVDIQTRGWLSLSEPCSSSLSQPYVLVRRPDYPEANAENSDIQGKLRGCPSLYARGIRSLDTSKTDHSSSNRTVLPHFAPSDPSGSPRTRP